LTGANHSWGARGAVRVNGGAVHYRRAGEPGAPVVILLHGSPESASALFGVAGALEDRFDIIGFDTPGNGLSAPLDLSDPDADDYARALFAFMDVMGIERAGLYGFHTGAGTAMSAALLAPERIAALALDGYAVWTPQERADLLARYCVVHAPVWDGTHLARIWLRLEEQLIFFPWNTPRLDARMNLALTPLAVRLRRLRDWLTAWESYPAPYRAAFKRDGHIGPDRTRVPTLLGAMARDPRPSWWRPAPGDRRPTTLRPPSLLSALAGLLVSIQQPHETSTKPFTKNNKTGLMCFLFKPAYVEACQCPLLGFAKRHPVPF
jgi:pimeloyl-ACP methyl ester carboxylesterase